MDTSQYAYNYLTNAGISNYGAAGIVGNLMQESGLNPNSIGDNGAASGIAQWHSGFSNDLPTSNMGSSLDSQLGYLVQTLNTPQYSGILNSLNNSSSVADATQAFMNGYEKPASSSSLGSRIQNALNVFSGAGGTDAGTTSNTSNDPHIGGSYNPANWLSELQGWLANSHFWQRLLFGFLGLLLVGAAFMLLARGQAQQIVKGAL